MTQKLEIRDNREPGWFWADRDIVKRDGPKLGPYGIATYACLCAHANESQEAWPSMATIAKMIACSERKVQEVLKLLEDLGWITIEKRFDPEKQRYFSNLYHLLDTPPDQGGTAQHAPPPRTQCTRGTAQHAPGGAPGAEEEEPINESHPEGKPKKEKIPASQGADAPEPGPASFERWLELIQQPPNGSNAHAQLKRMHDTLFPKNDPPSFGRIGTSAKRVGGPGRLCQLLWEAAPKRPAGNVLDYVEATTKSKSKNRNAQETTRRVEF